MGITGFSFLLEPPKLPERSLPSLKLSPSTVPPRFRSTLRLLDGCSIRRWVQERCMMDIGSENECDYQQPVG